MAGIYIHIPFCKQACVYCNFHFSTLLSLKNDLLEGIRTELVNRKGYMPEPVETIYFGGGTPSMLYSDEISSLLEVITSQYNVASNAEITLEANPDDLSKEKLTQLKEAGINRLSIGIQSFHDSELRFMNRAHNAYEAEACLDNALQSGFFNISIDLIYGLPGQSNEQWLGNLKILEKYPVPHFSAYALTVEPKTQLADLLRKKKVPAVEDNVMAAHFMAMHEWARETGYLGYEISSFCKPGHESRHNSSYWQGKPYLGIGPSAHSFDGMRTRSWNIANNALYIKKLKAGESIHDLEVLSDHDLFNEYIMTSLRTSKGFSATEIKSKFGESYWQAMQKTLENYFASNMLEQSDERIRLTIPGRLWADRIMSDFFITNEDELWKLK